MSDNEMINMIYDTYMTFSRTGRVIGLREVRVVNDKVTISRLLVRVISGLQLNISPDPAIENGYVSETTVTRRLTAQYQVGYSFLL